MASAGTPIFEVDSRFPARNRVLSTPELRDMIFRTIRSPQAFCILRTVSKQFAYLYEAAMTSIYSPLLFARFFFTYPEQAIGVVRESQAIMAGFAVRQFLYELEVHDGWLIILVNEDLVNPVLSFIVNDGYRSVLNVPGPDPDRPRFCRRPTHAFEFACRDCRGDRHISVRVVIHDPLRALFSGSGMHGCDGWQFFNLYPRLGPRPNSGSRIRGRQPYLLTARECQQNLPVEAFSNDEEDFDTMRSVYMERWIGDSNTWLVPSRRPNASNLERQGWTIRLNVKRVAGTPHIHFWTDVTCRCLRHDLLRHTYVAPTPVREYAKRVLDRFSNALASGVGSPILGPDDEVVSDFDAELVRIIECFQNGHEYKFHIVGYNFTVDRSYCSYEDMVCL